MAHFGIEWKTFTETATIPAQQDEIHFIFKSDEDVTIEAGQTVSISTGVGFRMPNNMGGLIYPCGGFLSIYLPRFLADTDGRAFEIKIWNYRHEPIHIERGTNICKMMCQEKSITESLAFIKLNDEAIDPVRNEGSPGWILRSPRNCTIGPNSSEVFLTGVSTSGIPGYNAYVYPFHEFSTSNYLITDPMKDLEVCVTNCKNESIHITRGDNLGFIAVNRVVHFEIEVVEFMPQAPNPNPIGPRTTARG